MLVGDAHGEWKSFDLGQASSYLQLAAWELGVGSCIVTMHREDDAKEVLGIPADKHAIVALSFGYPADVWTPNKGGRHSLDDVVRWEKW